MTTTHSSDDMTESDEEMILAQKPPEDIFSSQETEIPAILHREMKDPLVSILNQLDPTSFVRFARASKATLQFCLTTPGIRIDVEETASVCRAPKGDLTVVYTSFLNVGHLTKPVTISDVDRHLARLRKWRFVPRMIQFDFGAQQIAMPFWVVQPHFFLLIVDTTEDLMGVARDFLASVGVIHIECLRTRITADSFDRVTAFVQDFSVANFVCWSFFLPEDLMDGILQQKVPSLYLPVLSVRPSLLSGCSIPILYLYKTVVYDDTFVEIIEKWLSSPSLLLWQFRFSCGRLFVGGALTVFGFHSLMPDEPDPGCRPLLFMKETRRNTEEKPGVEWLFYVICEGGRVFTIGGYDAVGPDDWQPYVIIANCDKVPEELERFL